MTSPKINKYSHQKKILSISICEPTMPKIMGKESNCEKHRFMLFSPLKRTFNIFHTHLKPLENQKFLANKLLY
jgi:hypothetical protein